MMLLFSTRERALLMRRLLTGLCVGALVTQIGCYSYLPIQSQLPAKPDQMSVTVNDRGREMLTDRVGPLLERIEGRYVSADASSITLAVTAVTNLRGTETKWTGEHVAVPREAILGYQDRPFSKPKTILFVALAVGGLVVLLTGLSLAVSGSGSKAPGPGDPMQSNRVPLR